MHFCRGILPVLAIVFPPNEFDYLHATIGARGGRIIPEERPESFLQCSGIFFTESGLGGALDIDRTIGDVYAVIYAVLHTHCIGCLSIGIIRCLQIDRFRDLCTDDIDVVQAECGVNAHGAADTNGYPFFRLCFFSTILIFIFFVFAECKNLSKGTDIQPGFASNFDVFIRGMDRRSLFVLIAFL